MGTPLTNNQDPAAWSGGIESDPASEARLPAHRTALQCFDKWLGYAIDIPAALLVLAEIVVLFSGVVSRYVFHSPLTWSDELASLLFLWLAMLGSVMSLRRGTHMRMTAFVDMASPQTRAFLDLLAIVAAAAFLMLVVEPAFEFASEEAVVITSSMEISNAWRASALPVGMAMMIVVALTKFALVSNWRHLLVAVAIVGATIGVFAALEPLLHDLGNYNLLIFFVGGVMALVFAGIPIAFAFGLATFGYLTLATSTPSLVVVGRMDEGMSHLILLAVPMFVFLGLIMEMTSMAKAMVQFLASLLGHVRGGLSYVLIGAMYLVSGISGSKAADMAAIAPVLLPEMKKRGMKEGDMVALLSATGAQTETIPPSIVLITIGSVTSISVAALFTGGLLPALLLAAFLAAVTWWRGRGAEVIVAQKAKGSEVRRAFLFAIPALALPFVIRAAVVEGVATATEVSTIGIAYSIIAGIFFYRCFSLRKAWTALVETAALSGAILLIIGTATGMAWALTQSGFSRQLATAMSSMPGGAIGFMAVSIVAFVILGSVLEGIPAIVLFGPLLFPIATQFGIHEVHYSMVVVLSMGIGLFAPPFGVGYYTACAISRVHPNQGMKPIVGYMIALILGTILVAAVPWISIGFLSK
jgi:tripartite ATP-independent transporter DctM subunit